jgi:hypothetical protein
MFAPMKNFVHTNFWCNRIATGYTGIWESNAASHSMLRHRQEKLQQPTSLHQTSHQRLKADLAKIWASAYSSTHYSSTHCYPLYSSGLMSSTQPEMLLMQHFL